MEILKKLSKYRNIILILCDMICIFFAYYIGAILISDGNSLILDKYYAERVLKTVAISILVYQLIFHITKRYNSIIRYEEGKDYVLYIIICIISSFIVSILKYILGIGIASTKLNILAGIFIGTMMVTYRVIISI